MKRSVFNAINILLCASAAVVSGCSSHPKGTVTVNPEAVVLTPDVENIMNLDVTLNVPQGYVSKRSVTTIEPVLILGNTEVNKFAPIVIEGDIYKKKELRRERLYGIKPQYDENHFYMADNNAGLDIPLKESIKIIGNFNSGKIQAYITTDGCGECYGTDTVDVAYLSNISNLVDISEMRIQWIDTILPAKEKVHQGHGEARIQFEVNKTDILPDLANNAAEMDSVIRALTPVIKDPLSTLNMMTINGSASAEGRYDKNVILARDRAKAAQDWIDSKLHFTDAQRKVIKVGSHPEGWGPVIASMHRAGDADSALVKEIVEKYPDLKSGEAEKRIRKLKCWPRISANHLAKDRRVIYNYQWTIKSFDTDEEVVEMFEKRPDALDESEFLRVARIFNDNSDDVNKEINVYETLLKYIPDSEIGLNNLAVLYYDNGRFDEAIDLLYGRRNLSGDMKNTLALSYIESDQLDKAVELLNDVDNENAKYNLGSLLAQTHHMPDAYSFLKDIVDLNSAVAALGVNQNQEAWDILQLLDDNSPKADYVRAITQVRLGNPDNALEYLKNAVTSYQFKVRAATEPDFMPLHSNPVFINLINQ